MRKPKFNIKRFRHRTQLLWLAIGAIGLIALIYRLVLFDPARAKNRAREIIVQEGGNVSDQVQQRIARKINAEMRQSYPDSYDDSAPDWDDMIEISKIPVRNRLVDAIGSAGKSLSLELDHPIIDDAAWDQLLSHNNITRLRISGDVFTQDKISQLSKLKSLYTLEIDNVELLAHNATTTFDHLNKIKELQIWSSSLSDELCGEIGSLAGLRSLSFYDVRLTNSQLEKFSGLASLTHFSLEYSADSDPSPELTSDGFEFLQRTPNLTHLHIGKVPLTDGIFEHVEVLTGLKSLSLYGAKISGSGFKHLSKLNNLKLVALVGAPIGDDALKSFPPLRRLKELRIYGTRVTPDGIAHLKQLLPNADVTSDFDSDVPLFQAHMYH
jgi:hypothetical protein